MRRRQLEGPKEAPQASSLKLFTKKPKFKIIASLPFLGRRVRGIFLKFGQATQIERKVSHKHPHHLLKKKMSSFPNSIVFEASGKGGKGGRAGGKGNTKVGGKGGGKGHHGGVITHVGSSFTTTVEKVDVVKVEVPINKLVYIVLDVSGSMQIGSMSHSGEGSRLNKALDGVKSILDEVCEDSDHFALVAFNNDVHMVTPSRPKFAVKWDKVAAEVRKLVGGQTRLWDTVQRAMDDIKDARRPKDVHVDLVVLTDGGDNLSGRGANERLAEAMARPGIANFHAIFMACCGADVSGMNRIAEDKKHVLVIEEASAEADSISRAFGRAQTVLLERRTKVTSVNGGGLVGTTTFSAKGSKALVPRVLTKAAACGGGKAPHLKLLASSAYSGGGGGGGPQIALTYGGAAAAAGAAAASEVKPISPQSDLGRNIAALLADAPDGRITAAQFKAAYTKRFKLELDLKGGKLKGLLERCEAGGCCRLKEVKQPDGHPPVLWVRAVRGAASC